MDAKHFTRIHTLIHAFSNLSDLVWTQNFLFVFTFSHAFSNLSGEVWTWSSENTVCRSSPASNQRNNLISNCLESARSWHVAIGSSAQNNGRWTDNDQQKMLVDQSPFYLVVRFDQPQVFARIINGCSFQCSAEILSEEECNHCTPCYLFIW